jgi:hypothetical protein
MFKVPESLTHVDILGMQIPVIIDQARCEHMGALGMFDGSIVLRSTYDSHELFMKTLVHESFHASCYTVGLQLDVQIEEVLATTSERLFMSMSNTFHDVFTENIPEVEEMLEEKPKRGRGRPRKGT